MASKDSFILYQRYEAQLELLTMEQRGELFTAIFVYNGTGTMPEIKDAAVKMALSFIVEQLDHDKGRYDRKCEKNAANAAKRWGKTAKEADGAVNEESAPVKMHKSTQGGVQNDDANADLHDASTCERMPTDANAYERMRGDAKRCLSDSDSDSESDSDSDSEREVNLSQRARAREKLSRTKKKDVKVYGQYGNVVLTDAEYEALSREFSDIDRRIERLSEYIAQTGKAYENHCATIRAWSKNGLDSKRNAVSAASPPSDGFDSDEFFSAAIARTQRYSETLKQQRSGTSGA